MKPATIDVVRTDLFTPLDTLNKRYDAVTVQRIMRIRSMYEWMLSNPDAKDREFVSVNISRHAIGQSAAYSDLAVIKQIVPMLAAASREYHRWKANEMLIETYRMAKARKDTKAMGKAAADYARYNRVDLDDEKEMPYDMIVVQPFTATQDPSVLGIKPIPNIQQKIADMIAKYRKETMDIEDIECEEADLEEADLWSPLDDGKSEQCQSETPQRK